MEFKSNRPQRVSKETLTRTRENLGFDDIPVDDQDMSDVRFRDILRAWAKQAVKNSPLENKLKGAAVKKGRLTQLKNDLKWAMQADLDEPVKPSKRQYGHSSVNSRPTPQQKNTTGKTIDININLGSVPKLPPLFRMTMIRRFFRKIREFRFTRGRITIASVVVLIAIAGTFAWRFIPKLSEAKTTSTGNVQSTKISQSPEYETLLPAGKSIESLGGWHRVSPPDRTPVFAYADKIGEVPINVSQQPLPDNFKLDTDQSIADLAKSYAATDKITAGSLTIYVGTSAQGPQSAILTMNDLLILIKSTQKIDDKAWASYAESLNK